jgi:hypothetical protein
MPNTTNYNWVTPADTDLVKDGAAAIRTLGSSIDTTTKNLNPSTTLGDIEYRSSTANVNTRLPLGTANQQLRVNSGATAPEWFSPAASGGMTLISETVASANSSISLSSIPSTYKQLLLIWCGIQHSATDKAWAVRLNNDSGANYMIGYLYALGAGAAGGENASRTSLYDNNVTGASFGFGATGAENGDARGSLLIDNYASTTKDKFITGSWSNYDSTYSRFNITGNINGKYNSTTAITSIDIVQISGSAGTITNRADTSIRLYGLA